MGVFHLADGEEAPVATETPEAAPEETPLTAVESVGTASEKGGAEGEQPDATGKTPSEEAPKPEETPEATTEETTETPELTEAQEWLAARRGEIDALPDNEEKAALLQNLISGLPEELRNEIPELKEIRDRTQATEQETERSAHEAADQDEDRQLSAVNKASLTKAGNAFEDAAKALWDLPADQFPEKFDPNLFDLTNVKGHLALAALAEGTRLSRGIRAKLSADLVGALEEYGDVTEADVAEFSRATSEENKSLTQVYLGELTRRVTEVAKTEARTEMEAEYTQRLTSARAAIRIELAGQMGMEPERTRGPGAKGDTQPANELEARRWNATDKWTAKQLREYLAKQEQVAS